MRPPEGYGGCYGAIRHKVLSSDGLRNKWLFLRLPLSYVVLSLSSAAISQRLRVGPTAYNRILSPRLFF